MRATVPESKSDRGAEASQPRLAYLTSRYPAVSHTFIYREIVALREAGVTIETSSVNPPDRPLDQLPACELAEAKRVFYIKNAGLSRIVGAHVRMVLRRPGAIVRGMALAVHHGGASPKRLARWGGYLAEAIILGDWLRSERFSHLHVHFATEVANVGYLAAKMFGVGLSMTVHGPDEFYDVSHYALARKVEAARLVCCVSYYTRSQLMKLTAPSEWHKIHVARLGVDLNEFAPQPFRSLPAIFELLCVGRLVPAKGQHILLRAIAALWNKGYRMRLRFVGDGPDRENLEQYCKTHGLTDCVVFEGAVNQDRIRQYIQNADLFVLASFAEGIPVALMEAMASEVACISTVVTGIPELIRSGIDGLLVPSSDETALAQAIATLMDDPALRERLARAGRVRVADQFEITRNVTRLRNLLCDYVDEAGATPLPAHALPASTAA